MDTKVVNLYGGPGTGKSTIACGIFNKLKWNKVNCELVTEYAKEVVWSGDLKKFDNQLYIFAKQYHRIFRLLGKVEVIVTDSPILMSIVYSLGDENEMLRNLICQKYKEMNNIDIFLTREKDYTPIGRLQTKDQAVELDGKILSLLSDNGGKYYTLVGNKEAEESVVNLITKL